MKPLEHTSHYLGIFPIKDFRAKAVCYHPSCDYPPHLYCAFMLRGDIHIMKFCEDHGFIVKDFFEKNDKKFVNSRKEKDPTIVEQATKFRKEVEVFILNNPGSNISDINKALENSTKRKVKYAISNLIKFNQIYIEKRKGINHFYLKKE